MANTRFIHFRVNNDQFEAIKYNAGKAGFKTTSTYLRKLALENTIECNVLLNEIYHICKNIQFLIQAHLK